MKKAIVTILLVLPFLLIYFISFTGQILAKYTHINVERIAVVNEAGDEYNNNVYIKIGLHDKTKLRVKVYPELASNKDYIITQSGDTATTLDKDSMMIEGIEYGESTFVITSVDRNFVQFVIKVRVAEDKMTDFELYDGERKLSDTDIVELGIAKSKEITVKVIPQTALLKYRNIVWESENISIATVSSNGVITGLAEGTVRIKVQSRLDGVSDEDYVPIVHYITVSVTTELPKGVYFDVPDPDGLYIIHDSVLDLKLITKIVKLPLQLSDITYSVETSYDDSELDTSKIDEGIIEFKVNKAVTIALHAEYDGVKYPDQYVYVVYSKA